MSTLATMSGLSPTELFQWRTDGFVVLRGLFQPEEIGALREETERLLADAEGRISPSNLRCRFMPHHATGVPLFEVFDPVNDISPVCERFTADPRIHAAVESIYGEPAVLFKEKLIFKPPGAKGYDLHQDIPLSWASFPRSFLTVLIPIDPTTRHNGCTEVFAGYHHDFLSSDPAVYMLPESAVDSSRRTWLELEPGDVAIFHGLTPHGSAPNRSDRMRRSFYVSYNAVSDGGDQRASHYAEFQEKMRSRFAAGSADEIFFR